MFGLSIVRLAIGSLIEHPLRTALTALGVMLGVAAVYFMLAIGEGSKQDILEQLDSISARSMSVFPDRSSNGRSSTQRVWKPFSEDDIIRIRGIGGVLGATGSLNQSVTAVTEASDWTTELHGIDLDYLKTKDIKVVAGEPINSSDMERRETVALIGQTVLSTLFRGENPIGARIKINNVPFTVKGVLGTIESTSWRGNDQDNLILVPRTTARNRIFGGNELVRDYVNGIEIAGTTQDALPRIEREIDEILRQTRNLKPGDAPDYRIFNFSANRQQSARTQQILSMFLASAGAIVLLVGGVGLMNIMLVSVTERTREIGLRMALGARQIDIMVQFLVEAIMISFLSGLLGLALAHGLAYFVAPLLPDGMTLLFSPDVALLAVSTSLIVGVVFGFLPARRAAQLNPIEALRHE
ncbi:MAG: ABC transporter permease [Hyphomonadaceae bacterium]